MNKKLLMSAFALPIFFTACTNEFEEVAPEKQNTQKEIVGAKLVNGLTINVNRFDNATSRLSDAGWANGDQVGLAWYDITGDITGEQVAKQFAWNSLSEDDNKIYGNHKFIYNSGAFETQANVYEGAHFAYYPYAYMKQIGELVFKPNAAVQTTDYKADLYANSFHISAQDTILATSVNEDGKVEKVFDLVRIVNTLKFNLTSEELAEAEYMKTLPITAVELGVYPGADEKIFYNAATIDPQKLPYAIYDDKDDSDEDGVVGYDKVETKAQFYNVDEYFGDEKAIILSEPSAKISTEVNNVDYTLANAKSEVRMFLLPTAALDNTLTSARTWVKVYVPGGYFYIRTNKDGDYTTVANQKTLKELREILSTGWEAPDGRILKTSELGNQAVKAKDLDAMVKNLNFELVKADFVADYSNIKTIDQWNGAVIIADELGETAPTFTVTGAINFADDEIKTPNGGVKVVTTGAGKLVVKSDVTWPTNIAMGTSENINVEVAAGATLTIADNKTLDYAAITNNGTIALGVKSTLKNVTNNGRIEVVYGSYVDKNSVTGGIVAYEVEGTENVYQINNLIATDGTTAAVNTLVIGEGITFNLSDSDEDGEGFDDPYSPKDGEDGAKYEQEQMKLINFELTGGKLTAKVNTGWQVANVDVLEGTANSITNVDIVGDLTIAKDAELVVDTEKNALGVKNSVLVLGDIDNNGELTINTDVYCKNFNNPSGATYNAEGNALWYVNSYGQGGTANGAVNRYYNGTIANNNEFTSAVQFNDGYINVVLSENVTYDIKAWAENAMGATREIVIDLNGKKITFNQLDSDWNNIVTAGAKLIIKNGYITSTGHNDGPWNRHDLNFGCEVELINVVSDKAIALKNAGTLKNVTIDDKNTSDTYALWIQSNGQKVSLDGCMIDMLGCTDGRGIKIDNQYVDPENEAKVTLSVKNTTFKTEEKAAILVKSTKGAAITLENIDITAVAADNGNAVWVDENAKAYYDLVTVKGGTKAQEK